VVPCWEHLSTSGWVGGQGLGKGPRTHLVVFGLFGPFWGRSPKVGFSAFWAVWWYLGCLDPFGLFGSFWATLPKVVFVLFGVITA